MMQLLLYLAPLPIVTVHTVCALLVYRRCGRVHRPTVATLPFGGAAPACKHTHVSADGIGLSQHHAIYTCDIRY